MTPIVWPESLLIIDTETTGLDPARHGILSCAVLHPQSGAVMEWMVDPRPCEFDIGALRVNGLTLAALEEPRLAPVVFLTRLVAWIRDMVPGGRALLVGRNPAFDWGFLERAAAALSSEGRAFFALTFNHRKLDTHGALLALAIARGWNVAAEKIDTLYAAVGLEAEPKPHTALGGVRHCLAGLTGIVLEMARQPAPRILRPCEVESEPEVAGEAAR